LSGKLEEIWAKMVREVLSFEKYAQNKMKFSRFCLFFEVICFVFFRASLRKFGQKSFALQKICLLLRLWV